MESVILLQILDETVCVSSDTNALVKGMNPSLLPPVREKEDGILGYLAWVR